MSIVGNYKKNTALAAVTGDMNKVKALLGSLESSKLEFEEAKTDMLKQLEIVKKHFSELGNNISNWPDYAAQDWANYIASKYNLFFALAGNYYFQQLSAKLSQLSKSVMNLMPKKEARQRYDNFEAQLQAALAYDFMTMLYLQSFTAQQNPQDPTDFNVDPNKAMNDALATFKTRKYKEINKHSVDTEKIVRSFPINSEEDWLRYVEHTTPSIFDIDKLDFQVSHLQ
jgi:hypothetical protein